MLVRTRTRVITKAQQARANAAAAAASAALQSPPVAAAAAAAPAASSAAMRASPSKRGAGNSSPTSPRVAKRAKTTSRVAAAAAAASLPGAGHSLLDSSARSPTPTAAAAGALPPPLHVVSSNSRSLVASSPVPMLTSPDAAAAVAAAISPPSLVPSSSVSPASSLSAASSPSAAPSAGGGGGGADMRSLLRQAALERAARNRRAQSTGSAGGSVSPASVVFGAAVSPSAAVAAGAWSPSPSSSPPSGSASREGLKAPPHLRLNISSPQGPDRVSTPVVYTGAASLLQQLPSLQRAVSSPSDEFAGFGQHVFPTNAASSSAKPMPSGRVPSPAAGGVTCPLCQSQFPADAIEAHASSCNGELHMPPVAAAAASSRSAATASPVGAAAATASLSTSVFARPSSFSSAAASSPSAAGSGLVGCISSIAPTIPLPFFPRVHDTLRLLTWNVWFDDFAMQPRMDAIGSVVAKEEPHFVALQEVTQESGAMIRKAEWARKYHISAAPPDASYFTLLLSKFPLQQLRRLPFQSQMGRDLLCAQVDVSTSAGIRRLTVATSHLESERRNAQVRRTQLDAAMRLLSGNSRKQGGGATRSATALYCGDMNLAASEATDIPAKHGWADSWLALYGEKAERKGATYDTISNAMIRNRSRSPSGYQARYDRVWARFDPTTSDAAQADVTAAAAESKTALSNNNSPTPRTASAEWRLVSLERVGLCALDLRDPSQYAQQKPYKTLEASPSSSSSSAAAAAAALFAGPSSAIASSAAVAAPRTTQSWGSLSSASPSSSTPVFPSDHFGLVLTLQLNSDASATAAAAAPASST